MDRYDWFVIPGFLLIVAGMIYAGTHVRKMSNECTEKNGVLVKTSVNGYICIDKGVLKHFGVEE